MPQSRLKECLNVKRRPILLPSEEMKTSDHFDDDVSKRPDRIPIRQEWRELALRKPLYTEEQNNGWTKHWIYITEAGKWLRVVVRQDGETVHTNFFDRNFEIKLSRWWRGLESGLRRWPENED
jgi:hypothetical protein